MVTRIFSETNKPEGNSTEKSPSQNQCLGFKKTKHEDKIFLISWQLAFKSSKITVWNAKFCNAKNSNWFNLMKHQLFSLKTKFPFIDMTIFATCEEQIKLNELVIAQSISICLAEVYISIPVHTKLDRQWGKTTNYWSIDINDRKWVAQTKPSTFYFSSLSWPLFNLHN